MSSSLAKENGDKKKPVPMSLSCRPDAHVSEEPPGQLLQQRLPLPATTAAATTAASSSPASTTPVTIFFLVSDLAVLPGHGRSGLVGCGLAPRLLHGRCGDGGRPLLNGSLAELLPDVLPGLGRGLCRGAVPVFLLLPPPPTPPPRAPPSPPPPEARGLNGLNGLGHVLRHRQVEQDDLFGGRCRHSRCRCRMGNVTGELRGGGGTGCGGGALALRNGRYGII